MASEIVSGTSAGKGAGSAVKLISAFLLTFFFIFVVAWVYDLFAENTETQEIEASQTAGKPVLAIDPNIEKELAKVLEYETDQPDTDLKDPFSDRSNLSDVAAARLAHLPTRDQIVATPGSQGQGGSGSAGGSTQAGSKPEEQEVKIDVAKETVAGLERRRAALRAGRDPGPESAIFFIDDLLPVGMVSGGNAPPEVLMYSITMKRTYSFPAGAMFRDGWLATWRSDGVAFGDATRGGAIFLKPWATNLSEGGGSKQVVIGMDASRSDTE